MTPAIARVAALRADNSIASTQKNTWLVVAGAVVAAIRIYECGLLPSETGDVVRHLLYGLAVLNHGFAAAASPLTALSTDWSGVAWARFPYSYPPVTLAFFALIASISPTVFAAKFALTLIEAGNAFLIGKLTRSRVLGLLYWASPLSIWWVSREGQFEPLQAIFMLLSIGASLELPLVCGAALALAISVKVTAGALAPWIAGTIWPRGSRGRLFVVAGFVVGLVPLVASEIVYGGISNVMRYGRLLRYNPYYWNPSADMFAGNSSWQVGADETASYGMLAVLVVLAFRTRKWLPFVAPIAFVVFCKVHTNVEFWYWLLLPAFLVPVPDARWRFALIALCPLLDVHSAIELIAGPNAPTLFHGLPSAFDRYTMP